MLKKKKFNNYPNRLKDYEEDKEISTSDKTVYATKKEFEDPIYTRGRPYNVKKSIDCRTIKFISALKCD